MNPADELRDLVAAESDAQTDDTTDLIMDGYAARREGKPTYHGRGYWQPLAHANVSCSGIATALAALGQSLTVFSESMYRLQIEDSEFAKAIANLKALGQTEDEAWETLAASPLSASETVWMTQQSQAPVPPNLVFQWPNDFRRAPRGPRGRYRP